MTNEVFDDIIAWQKRVFPEATFSSTANHLTEEVSELLTSINSDDKKQIPSDYADCLIVTLGSASLFGLSYEQIWDAVEEKMRKNKIRFAQ